MSAIHQALSDTSQRNSGARSGFNPLQTNPTGRSQRAWWWLSLVLVVAIAMVAGLRNWSGSLSEPGTEFQLKEVVTRQMTTERSSPPASQTPEPIQPEIAVAPPEPIIEHNAEQPHNEATWNENNQSDVSVATPTLAENNPPPTPQNQSPEMQQSAPVREDEAQPELESAPHTGPEQPARATNTEAAPASPSAIETAVQSNRDMVTPSVPTFESRVQTAIADQDLPRAKQWLQQWISEEPELDVPRVWLARIFLAEDRLAQAQGLLQGQSSIEARALIGLVHERNGEYPQAAALYERLAREDPGNEQWWLRWAINLENSGQLAQARNLYQTYLQVFPGQDSSLTRFAQQRYQSLEGQP